MKTNKDCQNVKKEFFILCQVTSFEDNTRVSLKYIILTRNERKKKKSIKLFRAALDCLSETIFFIHDELH